MFNMVVQQLYSATEDKNETFFSEKIRYWRE